MKNIDEGKGEKKEHLEKKKEWHKKLITQYHLEKKKKRKKLHAVHNIDTRYMQNSWKNNNNKREIIKRIDYKDDDIIIEVIQW